MKFLTKQRPEGLCFMLLNVFAVQTVLQLEIDCCTELEHVVLAVVFLSDAIAVVNLVIGKTESNCRSVLISYANSIAFRIVKTFGVEISLLITEIAAPFVVPFLVGIDEEEFRGTVIPRHIL